MTVNAEKCDLLLVCLRRVIQAIDLHSKQLVSKYGLTGPQILLLKSIYQTEEKEISSKKLAQSASLSQATITSITDRLSEKKYITRNKSDIDKRKTMLKLTPKAIAVLEQKPSLLQEDFVNQFQNLEDWEQTLMLASLEKMAAMMHARSFEVAPVLSSPELIE
jgi:DNA-binding MarR family transcriptional regulator